MKKKQSFLERRFGFNKPACDCCGGSFGLARRKIGKNQFCGAECVTNHQGGSATTMSTSPLGGEGEAAIDVQQAAD